MEAAAIKMKIHDHEESIEQVRSKFSRQIIRLEKKECATEESRNEWNAEKAIYDKMKDDNEIQVTAHSKSLVAHENLMKKVKEEASLAEELAKTIGREVVVRSIGIEGMKDDELYEIQAKVVRCEVKAEEVQKVHMAAKASIDS